MLEEEGEAEEVTCVLRELFVPGSLNIVIQETISDYLNVI